MSKMQGTWVTGTIADSQTSTGEIDLGDLCDFVVVRLPSLTSCNIKAQSAKIAGGTYIDVGNGATTGTTTGNYITQLTLAPGTRHIKLVASAAQTGAKDIECMGGRD